VKKLFCKEPNQGNQVPEKRHSYLEKEGDFYEAYEEIIID